MQRVRQSSEDQQAEALTKAALTSLRQLGLNPHETAAALGVAAGALAAMRKGERVVDGLNGEAESADAIVRIAKRLGVLLGSEETKWRSWLRRESPALDAKPIELITQRLGAVKVATYLERADQL